MRGTATRRSSGAPAAAETDPSPPHARGRYFEALVEQSSDVIVAMDESGRVLYVSKAVERLLGVRRTWKAADEAFKLVHPDDLDRVRADFARKVTEPDEGAPITFRMRHEDGSWRFFEASGRNLLHDPEVRAVMVSLRDVTARVEAIAEVRETEQRYQRLVDLSPVPIAIHQHRHVVYVNAAAACLLGGRDREDIVGLPIEQFMHPALAPEIEERVSAALAGAEAPLVEERLLRLDGTTVHAEVAASPITWAGAPAVQVVARDITGQKAAEQRLVHQAHHDELTGLPNRSALLARLREALARPGRGDFAVAFLDLDRFKVVNDALGHAVGDELLVAVAGRLRAAVRACDVVSRFGGDEFVVLIDQVESVEFVGELIGRVLASLEEPFMIAGRHIHLSGSAGVVLGNDAHGAQDVLRDADTALYEAKRRGRSQYCVFDQRLRADAEERLETEQRLRRGLDTGELVPWFQPEVSLATGAVEGREALVRWHHPERGIVTPGDFLPVIEETGLAPRLTETMLEAACAAAATWRRGGPGAPWVSVNLTADDVTRGDLLAQVEATLDRHGLPASALCVEVTESSLISDPAAAAGVLGALQTVGVAIAIDDFGTGYSSLSYLKQYQPDFLKIDRSFVAGVATDASDLVLVQATLDVARALSIRTIAEGVETQAQHDRLRELGCDLGQGWFYGRPAPEPGGERS